MTYWRRFKLVLAASCVACAAPVHGEVRGVEAVPRTGMLTEAELSQQRGGFRWGGLDIRFGAEMKSYLDGTLVMQTKVNWADAVDTQHMVNAVSVPATLDAGAIVAATSGLSLKLGDENSIILNQGQTAIVQRTVGAIQNIAVNMASNVDLRQEVDAKLDIGGYASFGSALVGARVGAALSAMGGVAAFRGRMN